ncbi:intradiol ring-cleavage dioxygenase [Chryseobacterium sp. BIGb0232]|uniref:dioxygenase family protein n=1 Tax=Chryseobacterium sp. BIGb0232 TaxID=2940598 RepID=UPI000F4615F1|nr:intradiol ring-cleavage dioxygenase [Chryseobacterium sp. BIGb0232]MCS4301077.1 protocatechuate 3,4-dioxygenase beta subunit [Chryseobacterium sp. BIGb0232]ROS20060.1 protocatechuate 3,4-dioxygenase beta subunit [Chryseobacterium nakagawai]
MDFKSKIMTWLFLIGSGLASCQNQNSKNVGGPCEGCEALFEYGNKKLTSIDILPGFQYNEPKLKITGTVFKNDGKMPAENVIIYIYHTNRKGIYPTKGNETGWSKRHGFIRGWIKTGKNGRYTFYTFRPAAYPDGSESEHIHITIKESDRNEYYLDEYLFDDDPSLTQTKRNKLPNRGGSGIVKPYTENKILTVKRNIILGKNIPNYK